MSAIQVCTAGCCARLKEDSRVERGSLDQCCAVLCCAVQNNAVFCCAVQNNATLCCAVQSSAVMCCYVLFSAMLCHFCI